MSQLMERWPWPTKKQSSNNNSDPCAYQPPAVKLVLWASPEDDPFRPPSKPASEGGLGVVGVGVGGGLQLQHHHQQKTRRRWSKLPLRPFPTSLSAKMGWLTGQTDSSAVETQSANSKQNAVFRSNSFRFERPPPEDAEGGRIRGPIKSYSITAQDIASNVNEKYDTPKDPVSHRPLRQPLMTPKYQRSIKGFYKGIHLNTMESNPVDVVYSDPKDSKLYQTPGTDPPRPLQVTSAAPPPQPSNDVLCKMYVTGRESQYCRPYVTMRSFQPPDDNRLVSDYEEVNSSNCVTMIAVMPAGSGNGNTTTLASQPENLGKSTPDSTSLLASRSETSSSEGGSFIIDSNSFYENLNFHRIRTSMVRSSSEITPEDAGSHPDLSKFGYSQKEVWNWLYTEQDLNHNLRVVGGGPRPPKDSKAVEVKFTLSEFVTCYKRLMGLNLEGFSEFVNRTLEALISTSMMVQKTMTTDKRKCYPSTHPNVVQVPSNTTTSLLRSASRHTNTITTSNQVQLQNMQQQQHPQQMGQPGQNKTYVRLSVKRPPEKKAFSCYQTLMDVHPSNRAESVILEDMLSQYGRQLSIDLSQPLDRQEWYHGSITRHEAENALRLHEEGSFLVRNSESSSQDYSLSVKTARGFMHMKIQKPRNQAFILGQFSKPFKTIAEMLLYYSRNSLPVKGAEHISLKKPVCEQLL